MQNIILTPLDVISAKESTVRSENYAVELYKSNFLSTYGDVLWWNMVFAQIHKAQVKMVPTPDPVMHTIEETYPHVHILADKGPPKVIVPTEVLCHYSKARQLVAFTNFILRWHCGSCMPCINQSSNIQKIDTVIDAMIIASRQEDDKINNYVICGWGGRGTTDVKLGEIKLHLGNTINQHQRLSD